MARTPDLERFVRAQDDGGTYAAALAELRRGRKTSHWMWFVLPQIAGLGRSSLLSRPHHPPSRAQEYAVHGLDEARTYLAHPVLGPRLAECCDALLALPGSDPVAAPSNRQTRAYDVAYRGKGGHGRAPCMFG